jgi:hypothetical protein
MIQKLTKQPLLILFFLLLSAEIFAQGTPQNKSSGNKTIGRWQLVGEKQVDRVKEWDDFYPKGNGIYSAFKLKILNSRVKFDKMVIVYDNGRRQEVSLRSEIPQNGESRVVDVEGERRKIRKISFKYSTAGIFNDKAKVQVWGRK